MMTMVEMTKNMMTTMGEMIPVYMSGMTKNMMNHVYMSGMTKNMMIPVLCMWDDNEKQIRGNALKRQEARVTSCYQKRFLFLLDNTALSLPLYLD